MCVVCFVLETSDTILAKYRTKGVVAERVVENGLPKAVAVKEVDDGLVADVGPVQIDGTSAFADAKKKLRHVFSSSSVVYILPKQVSILLKLC